MHYLILDEKKCSELNGHVNAVGKSGIYGTCDDHYHSFQRLKEFTLGGCGRASLDFGNCMNGYDAWYDGYVKVFLNGNEIGIANKNELSKKIEFDFNNGDLLQISSRRGLIKFNNFTIINCCKKTE